MTILLTNKLKRSFIYFIFLFFLSSCETLINIPEKIYNTGVETVDYVASVFESENSEESEIASTDSEIDASLNSPNLPSNQNKSKQTNNNLGSDNKNTDEDFSISESQERLDPNEPELVEAQEIESPDIIDIQVEESDSKTKSVDQAIKAVNNRISEKLVLKNKIQFKIATINFRSGSSQVSVKGKRKIMKVNIL